MILLTPLKAIRLYCLEECEDGGSYKNVKECYLSTCPLYEYRSGHNSLRRGIGNHNAKLPKRNEAEFRDDVPQL